MLLRRISTRREVTPKPVSRYQEETMTSQVLEDDETWVESWESSAVGATKKADVETGEDQKGR